MLKLKIAKEDFDKLPDALKTEYKAQQDGTFTLDSDAEDVTGLKSALTSEREEAKALKAKLKGYEGIDVEQARKALEDAKKAEQEKAAAEGRWHDLKAQLLTEHEKEMKGKDGEVTKLKTALEDHLVVSAAVQAIAAAKGNAKILLPHVLANMQVIEENGEFKAVVVDEKGNPRIAGSKGEPMKVDDLIAEMKGDKDYGVAFEPSGKSGSGAGTGTKQQSQNGGGSTTTVEADSLGVVRGNIADIASGKTSVTGIPGQQA